MRLKLLYVAAKIAAQSSYRRGILCQPFAILFKRHGVKIRLCRIRDASASRFRPYRRGLRCRIRLGRNCLCVAINDLFQNLARNLSFHILQLGNDAVFCLPRNRDGSWVCVCGSLSGNYIVNIPQPIKNNASLCPVVFDTIFRAQFGLSMFRVGVVIAHGLFDKGGNTEAKNTGSRGIHHVRRDGVRYPLAELIHKASRRFEEINFRLLLDLLRCRALLIAFGLCGIAGGGQAVLNDRQCAIHVSQRTASAFFLGICRVGVALQRV